MALPVVAIKVLIETLRQSKGTTFQELMTMLVEQSNILKSQSTNGISMIAGCDLFLRFVNRQNSGVPVDEWKERVIETADQLVDRYQQHRAQAANHGVKFVKENCCILVHSYSRVVLMMLKLAAKTKRFKVIVTESYPSGAGKKAVQELRNENIMACLIQDSAVGYIIQKVDMVLVGAEGVVQNGGIVNQIGTYQIAVVAKAANIPFYTLAESYKFVQLFPLNQDDLPFSADMFFSNEEDNGECKISNPLLDYTPPEFITLLFTDVGVLTPSGVAEQLVLL
ncbi:hypothetical protein EDD86DRAFT_196007 [Gorgonomyces haynaldii]|nr:hypothetical protein EDD86DRAFT_196007 [Gorgonomyces haynaldii]